MADTQKILDALAQLDHGNDSHWLDDGTPKTGIVQRLAKDDTIKRDDIWKAAPGFVRNVDPLAEVNGQPVTDPAESLPSADMMADPAEPAPVLSVADAQAAVVKSQVRLRQVHDRQRDARGAVGRALARWQHVTAQTYTPDMAARDYIATSLAERAAGGGRRQRNRPGPSVVDQMAFGHGRSVNVGRYGAWKRRGMSIADAMTASGSDVVDTGGTAKLPGEG